MAGIKMTIAQVCEHPNDFLYIFADDQKFLPYIDFKHRAIIVGKRANQNKIILLSAKEYGSSRDEYVKAIREAFIKMYGVTPAQALITLAEGGEVAGKNWKEGIYGVGSVAANYRSDFIQNPNITVNPETGEILSSGVVVSSPSSAIYTRSLSGKAVVANYSYKSAGGEVFTSQFNKALNKYFAGSYATASVYQNADGKSINGSDLGSNWEDGVLSVEKFGNWLMELLERLGLISSEGEEVETISAENTLPSQTGDGFVAGVDEANWGNIGLIALGATLIASGAFKKFWGRALKSKKRK